MGVFLPRLCRRREVRRLPHARGGVSTSLRPRFGGAAVFPTHVGVFPLLHESALWPGGLPHARGGVSRHARHGHSVMRVFPTHVGVFLRKLVGELSAKRLPHARGGVSQAEGDEQYNPRSSPRTWGCFSVSVCFFLSESVFPTHVGVFPRSPCGQRKCSCLPHARGGVSNTPTMSSCGLPSSPRTWGCFSSTCGGC